MSDRNEAVRLQHLFSGLNVTKVVVSLDYPMTGIDTWRVGHSVPFKLGPYITYGRAVATLNGHVTKAWFQELRLEVEFEYEEAG